MQNGLKVQSTTTDMTMPLALKNQSLQVKHQSSEMPEAKSPRKEVPTVTQPQIQNSSSDPEIDPGELETALTQLNANVSLINERYSFQVDQNTNQLIVQVKDESGEVLHQVPPEVILDISSKISRMVGVFLDEIA
ncbi:MAG: flagellar protein FlaG [Candidatus Poribacteria bacterium]|nr:flagellar protein FlaG [Candidatus Poribacteria bacterium]